MHFNPLYLSFTLKTERNNRINSDVQTLFVLFELRLWSPQLSFFWGHDVLFFCLIISTHFTDETLCVMSNYPLHPWVSSSHVSLAYPLGGAKTWGRDVGEARSHVSQMESNPKKMLEGLHIPSGLETPHNPTGGDGRCSWRKVRLGTVCWHCDPDKQHEMDGQIFFLHFGLPSTVKDIFYWKLIFLKWSHAREIWASVDRENSCYQLEGRSIFNVRIVCMTQLCIAAGA